MLMPQQRHKFLYWMNIPHKTHKNTISTRARVIRPWVILKNLYHTKDPWQDFRVGKMHLYLRPLQLARDALRKRAKKVEKSCISCVYLSSIPSAIFHYQWSFHTVIHLKSLVNASSMQDACHIWVLGLGVFFQSFVSLIYIVWWGCQRISDVVCSNPSKSLKYEWKKKNLGMKLFSAGSWCRLQISIANYTRSARWNL